MSSYKPVYLNVAFGYATSFFLGSSCTVEPRLTNIPTYEHSDLRTELRLTNTKKAGGKGEKFKFTVLTIGGEEAASL